MIEVTPVSELEYYLAVEAEAEASAGGRLSYYSDNESSPGTWWTPGPPRPGSVLAFAESGSRVSRQDATSLSEGRHPRTGQPLLQANAKRNENSRIGYDLCISAPKSVSTIWACGNASQRAAVEAANAAAVARALEVAHELGLIETRRGSSSRGTLQYEAAEHYAIARFQHSSNRDGEPQLHEHCLLMMPCVRADGSTGGLDNYSLKKFARALDSIYKAELAAELQSLGIAIEAGPHGAEVAGVPAELCEKWSSRKQQIDRELSLRGLDSANHRAAAQSAAFATRQSKSEVPSPDELEEIWNHDLESLGLSRRSVWDAALAYARLEAEQLGAIGGGIDPVTIAQRRAVRALDELLETDSVIEQRHLIEAVARECQGLADAGAALEMVEWLRSEGRVIVIGRDKQGNPVYSTHETLTKERELVRTAEKRRDEREFVSAGRVEKAIASTNEKLATRFEGASLSTEQTAAIRHALNQDGVSIVEGSAGAGKSTSLAAVADAIRATGVEPHMIAPSWKATSVLEEETRTAGKKKTKDGIARAVTGYLHRLEHGDIELDRDSVVIVDEAGMVGLHDLDRLVRATAKAGAKLVMVGDTRQLQPVAAGSPLRMLQKTLTSSRINEIRRQRHGWMREASMAMAHGEVSAGMKAYDEAGAIQWADGPAELENALLADYADDIAENPDSTRIVVTQRNVDVNRLNARLRELCRDLGLVEESRYTIRAIGPGANKATDLEISIGDRVIFGESFTAQGYGRVNNSDVATVLAISGSKRDPVITFKFDKDSSVQRFRPSEMAGWRDDPKAEPVPRLGYAYCTTVHKAQGATVDHSYVVAATPGSYGSQSAYVAATRHREQCRLYINAGGIAANLATEPQPFQIDSQGHGGGAHADDEADDLPEVALEDVKAAFWREVDAADVKANASDYLAAEEEPQADSGERLSVQRRGAAASEPPAPPRSKPVPPPGGRAAKGLRLAKPAVRIVNSPVPDNFMDVEPISPPQPTF